MAQYGVTHTCGHTTTARLYGPGKDREAALRRMRDRPCGACIRATTNERAAAQQDERDLPPLSGSPKQIEWAERCRYHALMLVDQALGDAAHKPGVIPIPDHLRIGDEPYPSLGECIQRLYAQDTARFWIDHAKHAERAGQRIAVDSRSAIRYGIPPTETEQVARLLFAVAGYTDPSDRHIGALAVGLAPGAAAIARMIHPATLEAHVESARRAIRDALRGKERPFVAVSGGKDSAVVMDLVLAIRPDATLFWSDDELEYPGTVDYMTALKARHGDQFVTGLGWARHADWFDPWRDEPFFRDPLPGTVFVGMDADDYMASRGHDTTMLGTRAEESKARAAWLVEHGPTYRVSRGTGLRCCPIWDWPVGYVYQYLEERRLPINAAYARLAEIGVSEDLRRVGPLPLARRDDLVNGWPDLYARLVDRYGHRWTD